MRDTAYIEDRVTADGGDGWPVEPGRYRLVVARACPWANRAIIVRRLLGLEPVLSMAIAGPTHDERSWRFDLDPGGVDPVLGIPRLEDAFEARFPGYPKGITVPAIVDVPSGQVVTNDYPQMTLDLSTEWTEHHRPGAPDLYPEAQRAEIDEVADLVYRDVNNGVAVGEADPHGLCRWLVVVGNLVDALPPSESWPTHGRGPPGCGHR
ncbi:MAG TPA: hypothetical protein PKD89_12130 [Candidatus Microthrix sp.]|nr:hypothetical protein [Candidatus Microthrix sp.]HMS48323.1 hypothetical protein [Candidatus Microthrix sp.]